MKLDIVKHKFIYLAISAILLIPGIIAMVYSMITYDTHTPVKVGIDYTGGTTLQYGVKEDISNNKLSQVREALEKVDIEKPVLQIINVNSKENTDLKAILSIRTKFIDEESKDLEKITKVVESKTRNLSIKEAQEQLEKIRKECFELKEERQKVIEQMDVIGISRD